jgi:hypothetical protein
MASFFNTVWKLLTEDPSKGASKAEKPQPSYTETEKP